MHWQDWLQNDSAFIKRLIRFNIVDKTIICMASDPPLGLMNCGKSAWTKMATLGLNKAVKALFTHGVTASPLRWRLSFFLCLC